jgi:hypothetical protein
VSSFVNRNLNQDITYWPRANGQATNDFGHANLGAPILIKGRWEDKTQQIRKPNNDEVVSSAEVLVDRDLELGAYLAKGDRVALGAAVPEDAYEIQDFRSTPDLRNLATERRAYL